jgi:hypothetical protein
MTATTAMIAAATAGGIVMYNQTNTECDAKKNTNKDDVSRFRIESHLMDKIQQKKYLSSVAKEQIPSTFRVLAIDLKVMRTDAFTGKCRLSHDKVFVDDVAPPKEVDIEGPISVARNDDDDDNNINRKNQSRKNTKRQRVKLKIPQKALAKSIVHCSSPQSQQHVGVELLEASISDLNPMKLRKKQSIGDYSYDPGKYYSQTEKNNNAEADTYLEVDEDNIEKLDPYSESSLERETVLEMEAPWNQYAWMEELRLRINGQIQFDAPLEKSSRYERVFFGRSYKITVPAVHKMMDYFIPFSFAKSDPDGVDGRSKANVRACNKPHAVIANGAALQKVRQVFARCKL